MGFIAVVGVVTFVIVLELARRGSRPPPTDDGSRAAGTSPAQTAGPVAQGIAKRIVSLLTYVLGPLRLLRTHEINPAGAAAPLTGDEFKALPAATQRSLTEGEAALQHHGFGRPARVRTHASKHVRSYMSLLELTDQTTLATVSVVASDRIEKVVEAIFFRSQAADGTFVVTANGRVRMRFPRRPGFDTMVFPDVSDPSTLFALHRFRVTERAAGQRLRPVASAPDPVAYQTREMSETCDHWLRIGYYRHGAGDTLRLTLKGAAFTVWRAKFPWAQITDWRDERARRRVLARRAAARPAA
jgi:hypothetical protein